MINRVQSKKRQRIIIGALFCVVILSLGYFNDPPNGYTGAPGDDLCTDCHSLGTGMQNGNILLNGLPATIIANQTYTLTVTVSNPNGIADFAGFQSVILNADDLNAGTMSNPSQGSAIEIEGGRAYHEHNPAQMFGMSNAVSWTVNWTAPVGTGLITYYAAGNVANGNGNDNGDLIVTTSVTGNLITPLQVEITDVNHVSCFGGMDGSLTAEANFGEPAYTYQWSNGGSGQTIAGLEPGEYTVTVTDSDGATATASAEVSEPPLFEIVAETIDHVSCNGGNDGMIILVLDGGVPPYSGAQGDIATFANLAAGDYSIMITDANGCLISEEYTITEPADLFIELTVILEPDCNGGSTGLISVEGTGGTGDITYDWSNGSTNSTIQNLEAGIYSVTITDENGCTAAETIVLDEPQEIQLDLLLLQHVTCAGAGDGQISIDASGGTGDVFYEWSNGATSPTITGLEAGDYTVTVTDENGCTTVANYTITEPAVLIGTITGTMSLACFGDATGALQVQGGGGVPAYSFLWSNGSTNQTLTNLNAGNYSVTVTDANGCTASSFAQITQPPQLLPNATATGESAPGEMDGTATSTPTGGTGDYTFLWSTGEMTAMITGLAVGTYTVTVTDENGCTAMQTVAVTGVNCTLLLEASVTHVLCFGEASGTAQVNIIGATGPVDILWSNGDTTASISNLIAGMYSVMVTDSSGCIATADVIIGQPEMLASACSVMGETMDGANDGSISCMASGGVMPYAFDWSNGDTTSTIIDLAPMTYFLTITDSNVCTHQDTAVVNPFSCALQINLTVDDALCFGENSGVASVVVTGGTSPYAIVWSNGDMGTSVDSLLAGAYSITVTDADTCVITLPFSIGQPAAIVVTVDTVIQATQGTGGAIQISISGGTPPFTTVWTKNGGLFSTEEDLTDLVPGDYQLEILDANDCMLAAGSLTVTVSTGLEEEPGKVVITLWPNPVFDYLLLDIGGDPSAWCGKIYSAEGSLVGSFTDGDLSGNKDLRIDTEDLRTGLYYIRIVGEGGQKVLAFVKL
ncbi:MAG TPA: choice-of-anchor V domain-containing protein [Saprospiraceae bacterium]|nr:choice-of-anchor V domain-containing protein [Saprospiraceae bacterium]